MRTHGQADVDRGAHKKGPSRSQFRRFRKSAALSMVIRCFRPLVRVPVQSNGILLRGHMSVFGDVAYATTQNPGTSLRWRRPGLGTSTRLALGALRNSRGNLRRRLTSNPM